MHLNGRIGQCLGTFDEQFSVLKSSDGLPFHYTAFFEPFRCMVTDDIFFIGYQSADAVKKVFRERLLDTLIMICGVYTISALWSPDENG